MHSSVGDNPSILETYIVTNAHVSQSHGRLTIDKFIYLQERASVGTSSYEGEVVMTASDHDLALIRVLTPITENFAPVTLMSMDEWSEVTLYESVFLSSCGLAQSPYITNGNLSSVNCTENLMEMTTPIIFGSSGGGIYDAEGRLLGICYGMRATQWGMNGNHPVPHMALGIPLPGVLDAFRNTEYGFVFGVETSEPVEELDEPEDRDELFDELFRWERVPPPPLPPRPDGERIPFDFDRNKP